MEWIQNYFNCCIWLNRDKLGSMRRIKLFLGQCTLNKILYCNLFKPSWIFRDMYILYTVQKEIDFPRNNMKCSRENVILCIIFHAVSCFPQHFMLYRGNLDCFSNSVCWEPKICRNIYLEYSVIGLTLGVGNLVTLSLLSIAKVTGLNAIWVSNFTEDYAELESNLIGRG